MDAGDKPRSGRRVTVRGLEAAVFACWLMAAWGTSAHAVPRVPFFLQTHTFFSRVTGVTSSALLKAADRHTCSGDYISQMEAGGERALERNLFALL